MKYPFLAAILTLTSAVPAHASAWTPASLPDAAPVALVALGFLAIAGAMRGRKL
jgi:hypothetical protein